MRPWWRLWRPRDGLSAPVRRILLAVPPWLLAASLLNEAWHVELGLAPWLAWPLGGLASGIRAWRWSMARLPGWARAALALVVDRPAGADAGDRLRLGAVDVGWAALRVLAAMPVVRGEWAALRECVEGFVKERRPR